MLRALGTLLVCAGCAAAPPCTARPTPWSASDRAVRWHRVGTDEYLLAEVGLAGYRVAMVVDSGANLHAVERGVAWWLELPSAGDAMILDGAGVAVPAVRVGPVPLDLARGFPSERIELHAFTYEAMLTVGLGGFLSPQRAASLAHAVLVDLQRPSFESIDPAAVTRALGHGAIALEAACESEDGVPLLRVPAEIGGERFRAVVDTGAANTTVGYETEIGAALMARASRGRTSETIGWREVVPVARAAVRYANTRRSLEVGIGRVNPCSEMVLGLDALRGCRLWITRSGGAIDCR